MYPEEKFDRHVLFVLKKIKEAILKKDENSETIEYTVFLYPLIKSQVIPHPTTEQNLLEKLRNSGIYTQIGEPNEFEISNKSNSKADETTELVGFKLNLKINSEAFEKEYEKYKAKVDKHSNPKESLTVISGGKSLNVTYLSISGKKYEAAFKVNTLSAKLLDYFSERPGVIFKVSELEVILDKVRENSKFVDPDRRIRSTIQYIRRKLGYLLDEDLFLISNGFGIRKIEVEIKRK